MTLLSDFKSPATIDEIAAPTLCAQSSKLGAATSPGDFLLAEMLARSYVLAEDLDALPRETRCTLQSCSDPVLLRALLVEHALLTKYQADRIEAGLTYGLVLGNYRVLARLGAGGMAVVFKAEHVLMRRVVAVKVLSVWSETHPSLVQRFLGEMRAGARLHHPNIVSALDAGTMTIANPSASVLYYFVMEYAPGWDLEKFISEHGPMPSAKACELAYQVARALAEVHKHNLVHRDIKPSNVLVTPDGQAKLLDFGLARHFHFSLTTPGVLLGTVDYMAPEQARDASSVDIRADLYGLGGTLFWCLTGQTPFSDAGSVAAVVTRRCTQAAPSVRAVRPELPLELDLLITRLMAQEPRDRYPDPEAVMQALLPFLPAAAKKLDATFQTLPLLAGRSFPGSVLAAPQVLIVDDDRLSRKLCRFTFESEDMRCDEAADGESAVQAFFAKPYDLVVLDICLPGTDGNHVLARMREIRPHHHFKIIMCSGESTPDEMARMLAAGADDFLAKPVSPEQLKARAKALLRLKDAQDHSDRLNRQLKAVNQDLEQSLRCRDSDIAAANNALALTLAGLADAKGASVRGQLLRMQDYCQCLAEAAARRDEFKEQLDATFLRNLRLAVPLHDIGMMALPDHLVMKPGKFDPEERLLMETHTILGADTLKENAGQYGWAPPYLRMALDVIRHHHERFDGAGYPDRLAGSAIPLAARITALADSYDALRSRRCYRPGLTHKLALSTMMGRSPGQFDPLLQQVFATCADSFHRIFQERPE